MNFNTFANDLVDFLGAKDTINFCRTHRNFPLDCSPNSKLWQRKANIKYGIDLNIVVPRPDDNTRLGRYRLIEELFDDRKIVLLNEQPLQIASKYYNIDLTILTNLAKRCGDSAFPLIVKSINMNVQRYAEYVQDIRTKIIESVNRGFPKAEFPLYLGLCQYMRWGLIRKYGPKSWALVGATAMNDADRRELEVITESHGVGAGYVETNLLRGNYDLLVRMNRFINLELYLFLDDLDWGNPAVHRFARYVFDDLMASERLSRYQALKRVASHGGNIDFIKRLIN